MKSQNQNTNLSTLILKKLITPSVFVFLVMSVFSATTFKFWINWGGAGVPFTNDVDQYYSYLIAQFIHHDFSFHFNHVYWLVETPTHLYVPKVTMGLSLLYLPFFVLADNIAYAFDFDALGYSAPYSWCLHFGSIIYVLIGVWYSRKSLLLFFNEWVATISIVIIFFGTNLFYYTFKESEMPHSYLFFLFSLFIYHVLKWRQTSKTKYIYYFSLIAGLVALIRPTEILILLFPLLIYVSNITELKERLIEIKNLKWKLIVAIFCFFLPLIPQFIYWKIFTGQFLFFSYGNREGFYFTDPQFYNVLFGWRKGWFIYTPLMLFAIIGLTMMFFKRRDLFYSIFLYFIINLYLISCWWDWGFGGAFGMRALVQSYAFLIIPLAFFINWVFTIHRKKIMTILLGLIFISTSVFFCATNMYQTYLMKNNLFHWDSMTKDAYFYTLFNAKKIDRIYLETLFKHPNYENLLTGKRDE